MLGTPRKLLLAIEATVDIAYNSSGAPVQSSDITRRQGVPRRHMEPVLQELVRADILSGVRGPRGGYRLARERRRITLGDIVRAVSGPDAAGEIADGACASPLGRAVVMPVWRELQDEMMNRLDEITVEDLCARARRTGLAGTAFQQLDYTI